MPVFEAAWGPRNYDVVGAEFGLVRVRVPSASLTVRAAMLAMIELAGATRAGNSDTPGLPVASDLWRALYGGSLSVASDAVLPAAAGGPTFLEASVLLGHESDHLDAAFAASYPQWQVSPKAGDIVGGATGNFIQPDLALRLPFAQTWSLTARVQDRVYVLGGSLRQAPGVDLVLQYVATEVLRPTVALFGEGLLVDPTQNQARNGFFARLMLGLAVRAAIGEVTPFVSLDAGNDQGLRINRRELRFTGGFRYAVF